MDLAGLADYSNIKFIGLQNYKDVLSDSIFIKAIFNTLFYVVIGVPLVILCSLGVAVLINFGTSRIFKVFRVVYYLPSVTNVVAVAVVWFYLYNPSFGLLNYLLKLVHLGPVPWLTHPIVAKISLILLALWRAIGLNMIIFIAGLQGIPKSNYEAAELDGRPVCSKCGTLRSRCCVLPSFRLDHNDDWLAAVFEEPFIMTQGGPLDSTTSVALFIYRNGFQLSHFGYAAAGSFILFSPSSS